MQWRRVRKQPQVCRSALRLREAAHWASWADTMKTVWARHLDIAETIMQAVNAHDDAPSVQAINRSREILVAVGFAHPFGKSWSLRLPTLHTLQIVNPTSPEWDGRQKWHVKWSRPLWPTRLTLSDAEGTMLRSQGGPLASSPFISFLTNCTSRLEPQLLRVLFLRRLRPRLSTFNRPCRRCSTGRPVETERRKPCLCEGVAGQRPATPSQKHGLH